MRSTFKVFFFLAAACFLTAWLTPVIYNGLPFLHAWRHFRFEKVFDRLFMIFVIAGSIWLVRARHESWRQYGFDFEVPWRRFFAYGLLAGGLAVCLIALTEVVLGPRYIRDPWLLSDIVQRFLKGMLSGVAVGIIEEFFFRGFVFVNLRRKTNAWAAASLTSAFYSILHFLDNGQIFIPEHPGIRDAVRLLFGYFEPVVNRWSEIFPEFLGLFLFGMVLNIAFMRSGTLFLPIGIHAGAVFVTKFQRSFVRVGPDTYHPLFGNIIDYDGPVEWIFLLVLAAVVYWAACRMKPT